MARKQTVKPDHLRVRVLGASEFQIGSRRIGMNTEGLFALGLYLSSRAGERIPRDEVLDVFWIEGEEESRRHAMRQMMYRLRQKGLVLDEEGEFLLLDAGRVDSDLVNCLKSDWVERATAEEVEAALALGPTFSTRMAAPFLEWFDGVRSAIAAQHRRAAQVQIIQARREGRWTDLDRWALSVLKTDPLNEEATLARAESAAMGGSKVAALEILDTYLAEIGQVAPELGKPAMVLRKRIAEKRADWSQKGPREVRLVGRTEPMKRLNLVTDSVVADESRSLLLDGPPGGGKTRLLRETSAYAQLRGVRVIASRAEVVMQEHPLAFARELASRLIAVPGAAGASPSAMNTVASLAHEASQSGDGLERLEYEISISSIATAFTGLISAIGAEQRSLLVLDDLQWADELSIQILGDVLRATRRSRVGVVAGARPSPTSNSASKTFGAFDQNYRLVPLSEDSARELALETAASHGRKLSAAATERIVRTAAGNPLFVRELAIVHEASANAKVLPESLSRLVEDRVRTLSPQEQRLLRVTALLGDIATLSRVRAASTMSHSELQGVLERLESEGMIQIAPDRALSVHDCWADVLLQQTPSTLLSALALECAELLVAEPGTQSPATQRRTGHLLRLSGESGRAIEYLFASADSLFSIGLPRQAMESLEHFRTLADTPASQARILYRKARCLEALGNPVLAIEIVEELRKFGWLRQDGLWHEHLSAIAVLAESYIRTENVHLAPIDELLSLASHSKLTTQDQQYACLFGVRIASNVADYAMLEAFAHRSSEISESAGSYPGAMTRIVHKTELGSAAEILAAVSAATLLDGSTMTVMQRCLLHRFACQAMRVAGDYSKAVEYGRAARDIAESFGLHHQARVAAELLVHVSLDYGEISEAEHWLEQSSRLSASASIATTTRSHQHATDRLAAQRGEYAASYDRLRSRLPDAVVAGTVSARLGEQALAAYCLANLGRLDESREIAATVLETSAPYLGRYSCHFPVEILARTLNILGESKLADELVREHSVRRVPSPPLQLPPFFTHLATPASSLPV